MHHYYHNRHETPFSFHDDLILLPREGCEAGNRAARNWSQPLPSSSLSLPRVLRVVSYPRGVFTPCFLVSCSGAYSRASLTFMLDSAPRLQKRNLDAVHQDPRRMRPPINIRERGWGDWGAAARSRAKQRRAAPSSGARWPAGSLVPRRLRVGMRSDGARG